MKYFSFPMIVFLQLYYGNCKNEVISYCKVIIILKVFKYIIQHSTLAKLYSFYNVFKIKATHAYDMVI
jgi:hypothetical protein